MATKTEDYKMFKLMHGNRQVNKAHVKNLAQSIALNPDLLRIRPILINKHKEIIDGQHRLAAAKMLKVPVWYEDGGDIGADEAVQINNNQRNWSVLDYARSFAAHGNQHYKDFLRVYEEHPGLPVNTIVRYIGGPKSSVMGYGGTFKNGKFEAKTLDIGEVYLEMLDELAQLYPRFGHSEPSMAMFRIFQLSEYDQDRMVKKLSIIDPHRVNLWGSSEQILRNLEDIYNFKQQANIIRFY